MDNINNSSMALRNALAPLKEGISAMREGKSYSTKSGGNKRSGFYNDLESFMETVVSEFEGLAARLVLAEKVEKRVVRLEKSVESWSKRIKLDEGFKNEGVDGGSLSIVEERDAKDEMIETLELRVASLEREVQRRDASASKHVDAPKVSEAKEAKDAEEAEYDYDSSEDLDEELFLGTAYREARLKGVSISSWSRFVSKERVPELKAFSLWGIDTEDWKGVFKESLPKPPVSERERAKWASDILSTAVYHKLSDHEFDMAFMNAAASLGVVFESGESAYSYCVNTVERVKVHWSFRQQFNESDKQYVMNCFDTLRIITAQTKEPFIKAVCEGFIDPILRLFALELVEKASSGVALRDVLIRAVDLYAHIDSAEKSRLESCLETRDWDQYHLREQFRTESVKNAKRNQQPQHPHHHKHHKGGGKGYNGKGKGKPNNPDGEEKSFSKDAASQKSGQSSAQTSTKSNPHYNHASNSSHPGSKNSSAQSQGNSAAGKA